MNAPSDPREPGQHDVAVTVQTQYLTEQSDPLRGRYVFAYTVTITNRGHQPARLVARHWVITNAEEATQEVRGLGVVGQHPHLAPGESFTYTSGTVIDTPTGCMHGSYRMVGDDGVEFTAPIPPFHLAAPHSLH
ncbi:MAG TPA: Co2+/Mg2+ efflux protein ApaG [Gammaproteobacteria bacterium]|uniref:Co2+/Mg2+ efflux protein ApaG n=1 Tax=Immundisolibacter sp. TaxID=1934948 RepID=UPI000E90AE2A|nr:Co2+/Mg2+ efflux protein ApaG [Gammaproteobacteria bacterium]HCZ47684.1 Co2+/Mg2+ efflux protein ApaG [Gammaproteobacteria bacterium]MCH77122.1 Co2+/Mg2+ efflux protein ApaG [Gammaproteobacteria bacterium]